MRWANNPCPREWNRTAYTATDSTGRTWYNNEIPANTTLNWTVLPVGSDITITDVTTNAQFRIFNYGDGTVGGMGWYQVKARSQLDFLTSTLSNNTLGDALWNRRFPTRAPTISVWDRAMMDTIQRSDSSAFPSLSRSVTKSPTWPVLNGIRRVARPDAISIGGSVPIPFWNPGATITLTSEGDVIGSRDYSPINLSSYSNALRNIQNPSKFLSGFSTKNLGGGISLNANYILDNNRSRDGIRDFFLGSSVTTQGCARICAGVTRTGSRTSFNVGFSPGSGGSLTIGNGTYLGNPIEWFRPRN